MRLCVALLFAIFIFGQSQPPTPTPAKATRANQEKTRLEQEKAESNDKSTQDLVAAINQLTAAVETGNQQKLSTQTNNKSSPNGRAIINTVLITIFTGILAIVAGLQFWAMHRQAEYMRSGLMASIRASRAAQQAARAAKASAEALKNTEQAWLFVEDPILPKLVALEDLDPMQQEEKYLLALCTVKNHGKTPAKVIAQWTELQIGTGNNRTAPPRPEVYEVTGTINPYFIPPTETRPLIGESVPQRLNFSRTEIDRLKHRELIMWLCGFVTYVDAFERKFRVRFCFRGETRPWDIRLDPAFLMAGPPEYNQHTAINE